MLSLSEIMEVSHMTKDEKVSVEQAVRDIRQFRTFSVMNMLTVLQLL